MPVVHVKDAHTSPVTINKNFEKNPCLVFPPRVLWTHGAVQRAMRGAALAWLTRLIRLHEMAGKLYQPGVSGAQAPSESLDR